jgi:peptidyl-prolyl cis-trans isomerase SurA
LALVSLPFRSQSGIHILKLKRQTRQQLQLSRRSNACATYFIKQSEVVSESEAKRKIENIKERIENGTKFEEMARQYSEDGSASNGGDLGWVNPGDTVPAFEKP